MLCVYRGPARAGSEYHGDIAAFVRLHGNTKVGIVAGLTIAPMRDGKVVTYWDARRTGADACVCGNCPHRSKPAGGNGTCYVGNGSQVGMGLAWLGKTDALPVESGAELATYLRHARKREGVKAFRSAVWGDAGALPVDVWQAIETACADAGLPVLGYTHAQLDGVPHLLASHVASIDGEACTPAGWRSFRVAAPGARPRAGEFACPASFERGHKLSCGDCLACGTIGNTQNRRSVVIWQHDTASQHVAKRLASLSIAH
jgi:hypothetical protein